MTDKWPVYHVQVIGIKERKSTQIDETTKKAVNIQIKSIFDFRLIQLPCQPSIKNENVMYPQEIRLVKESKLLSWPWPQQHDS